MTRKRPLTRTERLTHPWWGIACPSCGAEPGEFCGYDGVHPVIHGQRTRASTAGYIDPRSPEPVQPRRRIDVSARPVAPYSWRRKLARRVMRPEPQPVESAAVQPEQLALW